jgi:hypothetical protein
VQTAPFAFIHSPLVGTFTWQLAAHHLREQSHTVFTPELIDDPLHSMPLWRQEVDSVDLPVQDVLLVGHSGAGALLPLIGEKFNVVGYIFVDAVLLFDAATRLELMYSEDRKFAREFETFLRQGGQFPNWQDEHLQPMITDVEIRQKLLADMRPRALSFFTEQIETPANWDSPPCAYIQLSASYRSYAVQAEERGWLVIRRDAHHFEMLTKPGEIAQLLIQIQGQFSD